MAEAAHIKRKKKKRMQTVTGALESLNTDLTQLEESLDDSMSKLLQPRKRHTLITELDSGIQSPNLLRKAFRSTSMDKNQKKKVSLTARGRDSGEEQFHVKAIGMLNRLPTLPPSRLGPGSYTTHPARVSHIVRFELAPRFPMTYQEKLASYRPHARALTPEERKEITHRIRENILALKRYTPVERMKTLRERAAAEESRGQLSRTLKYEISQALKRKREEEIEVKQRRFEWRMRAEEISDGKQRWCGVYCALGIIAGWAKKFEHRKVLHARSQGILKLLLMMAITVGKICVRLRTKRRARAYVVMRRLTPYLRRWLRKHKVKLRECIACHIETSLSQDNIFRMIGSWKRRIIAIQRTLRAWMMQRKMHKQLMVKQWEKAEVTPVSVKPSKAGGYTIKEQTISTIVPQGVKFALVGEYIKVKVRSFIETREEWKRTCSELKAQHRLKQEEDPLTEIPPPVLPKMPRFIAVLSRAEIGELVASAEKKKSRWDRIAKEGLGKEQRSQRPRGLTVPGTYAS